jgi:hypothetical protein
MKFGTSALNFTKSEQQIIDEQLQVDDFKMTPQLAAGIRSRLIRKLEADELPIVLGGEAERAAWPEADRDQFDQEAHERVRAGTLYDLKRAEIVLWRNEIFHGAINGHEVFEGQPTELPEDFVDQLWMWDRPLNGLMQVDEEFHCVVMAVLVMNPFVAQWPDRGQPPKGRAFAGMVFAVQFSTEDLELRADMPWEQRLIMSPIFISEMGAPLDEKAAQTRAAVEFLRLPFVVAAKEPAQPRHERRRLEREGRAREIATIRIVTLRKAVNEHSSESGAHEKRDWSCHWMVRGHWRKQYLPSTGGHRPTWISPFVKGDTSKPYHSPEVIYRAAR